MIPLPESSPRQIAPHRLLPSRLPAPCCAQSLSAELVQQASQPLVFVDWMREPPRDEATGEVNGPRPSCYEAVEGGLVETR